MTDNGQERDRTAAIAGSHGIVRLSLALAAVWSVIGFAADIRAGALATGRTGPDFLCFWVASRAAAAGQAAALYDWAHMLPMVEHGLGHGFDGFLPWKYPPTALLILLPLAALPLLAAHLVWALLTLGAFLVVIFRTAGLNAVLAAVAVPLTVPEIIMGQNGFATASLIGLSLLVAQSRPFLAGMLVGLLSFKPQLCLLLPVVILARRDWRGVAGIALSGILLAAASAWAFGLDVWLAFFRSLHGNAAAFGQGAVPWFALQSVYAQARTLGVGPHLAIFAQASLTVVVLLAILHIERHTRSPALRSAAICAGTLLITPFMLIWDLTIIGVGMAFLVRSSKPGVLDTTEILGLLCLAASPALYFSLGLAVGYWDGAVLLMLAYRRTQSEMRPDITA